MAVAHLAGIMVEVVDSDAPLEGGNMGTVIRVGDTVRRPAGPWTPRVQQFMSTLRSKGLGFVPEPLGTDSLGREVVEYVEGDVGIYPMPVWVWTDELLVQAVRWLRRLHDVSGSLNLPDAGWRRTAVQPADVICHGDLSPYNVVCRGGHIVAVIDWDFAVPAPAGWDLGYFAYRWVSLTPPGHPDGRSSSVVEQTRRLKLICSQYGHIEPDFLVHWAVRRLEDLVSYSRARAALGDPAFMSTVTQGHVDLYESDIGWLRTTYAVDA